MTVRSAATLFIKHVKDGAPPQGMAGLAKLAEASRVLRAHDVIPVMTDHGLPTGRNIDWAKVERMAQ